MRLGCDEFKDTTVEAGAAVGQHELRTWLGLGVGLGLGLGLGLGSGLGSGLGCGYLAARAAHLAPWAEVSPRPGEG